MRGQLLGEVGRSRRGAGGVHAEHQQPVDRSRLRQLQGQRHADALGLGVVRQPLGARDHLQPVHLLQLRAVICIEADHHLGRDRVAGGGAALGALHRHRDEAVRQQPGDGGAPGARHGRREHRHRFGLPFTEIGRLGRQRRPGGAQPADARDQFAEGGVHRRVVAAPGRGPVGDAGVALGVGQPAVELVDMDVVREDADAQAAAIRCETGFQPQRQQ